MNGIYGWITRLVWPLPIALAAKLETGKIDECDMIHILVAHEMHDRAKGAIKWTVN